MTTKSELVARLEAASVGSRELDRDLAKLIDAEEWAKCANWASMPCGAPADVIDRDALRWLPAYTTSLDAALALAERVLPGVWWVVGFGKLTASEADYGAQLMFGEEVIGEGEGVSAALALCIAVLKATDQ